MKTCRLAKPRCTKKNPAFGPGPDDTLPKPQKNRFPIENPGRIRIRVVGGLGAISVVNIIKRLAQKLHRIILFHFEFVTFRIHFRKIRKPITFMVFRSSGHDHDSQNQLFLIVEAPRYFKNPRKSQSMLWNFDFGKFEN